MTNYARHLLIAGLVIPSVSITACGSTTNSTTTIIAAPGLINPKPRPNDASAKIQARTGQTAAETYSTYNNASYTGMTTEKLQETEPTLKADTTATFTIVGTPTATGYEVQSVSKGTGDVFTIKNTEGTITRTCVAKSPAYIRGCPEGHW